MDLQIFFVTTSLKSDVEFYSRNIYIYIYNVLGIIDFIPYLHNYIIVITLYCCHFG